ncbi:asparaginase [Candidatus Palauibacter polyketidifaciens]|uniref:asparaginase n=1 Tax=Candidatus Palauibacter polyketidifaciens TaxID=3056740 RepID=UPI00139C643E|nr:asparaginase [Candidatus Palauibacter polyketidifaciens]MDE2721125.1 asparaginase [Candidatus Palauibacter polyketidifaciens]MYE34391.1 asparaginase [Gemmatimonadales bacterium]
MEPIRVTLDRAGTRESSHLVYGIVHESGSPGSRHAFGDPRLTAFWRSSMKPLQILPVVRDGVLGRLGLGAEALALACASHHGTPRHLGVVQSVIDAVKLTPEMFACGPHRPFDDGAARGMDREGRLPGRIHNNCSGQHAALLALCVARGWPVAGYHEPEHPLQRTIRRELSAWLGEDCERLPWGTDGCGLPTPALSLRDMARVFAAFGASSEAAVRSVVTAMTTHPTLVSGPTALSANLMRASSGRILAKEGAEGVFCLASAEEGWGAAFKVLDGATRPLGPAVVHGLATLSLLAPAEIERLEGFAQPVVRNTCGEEVGVLSVQGHGG